MGTYTRQPMVPLDVPEMVWCAASSHYREEQWTPAPNYHAEYRDVRAAFHATCAYLISHLEEAGMEDAATELTMLISTHI